MQLMESNSRRLARERRTVSLMIAMYCHAHHAPVERLCTECAWCAGLCAELEAYALARIDKCPFGAAKPTCANCPVHCYNPDMRARVRVVMRYAGPRMLLRHPVLALLHLLDGRREAPQRQ
jgi:hypothetical protein